MAHVERGHATLSELVRQAHVVVRARVVDANAAVALPALHPPTVAIELPALRRPAILVEVAEVLKGDLPKGRLHFLQHGHGVASYRAAEEVLIFLTPTKAVRELADPRLVEAAPWTSLQQHDDRILLVGSGGAATLAAARRYVALAGLPPDERPKARADFTIELMTAADERLASMALLDLTRSAVNEPLSQRDRDRLLARIDAPTALMDFRVGLLSELSRRGEPATDSRWVMVLKEAKGADRSVVCRAAGHFPSQKVTAALVEILEGEETESARAAAVALGGGGHAHAVPALADALTASDVGLRNAAIRGLGRIGGKSARRVLLEAASAHTDPTTRRRASAELAARFPESGEER
ncbi:MAG: HEAT repeat domain-containing protein [Deltaproteobacteria bacterium]|nr:HEAT repeat domain-containing protein [Deltaproteobacteria bacterium]MBW2395437.1 HEAT repeat domain-containing protein [Deltaproteobacteria bacterium]